jgi:hypothetical protein
MDEQRPYLDMKHFNDICPDKNGMFGCHNIRVGFDKACFNVPMIAVFTKYDQFRRDVRMNLEDKGKLIGDTSATVASEVEKVFHDEFLGKLQGAPKHICMESG